MPTLFTISADECLICSRIPTDPGVTAKANLMSDLQNALNNRKGKKMPKKLL